MRRKFLSVVLCVCMMLTMAPFAFAAEGEDSETPESVVAKIGDQGYSTLQAAIEAATNTQTITLLSDIDLARTISVSNKTITLNLDGHKLYNTADLWDLPAEKDHNWSLISVRGTGNLTITGNGTLQAKENDCYAVDVQDGSTLTIENGTLVGNIHAVYVQEGTAYIKGGTYRVQQKYPQTGKEDEFVLNLYDTNRSNGTAKMTVTGGTFANFNPANCQAEGANTNFCAEGYSTKQEDEKYTVMGPVAAIGEHNYATLSVAVEAAGNKTVTLLKDVTEDLVIPADKTVTLNLNGKKLTNVSSNTITNNGTLTITGEGTVDNVTHAKAAIYNKGTVTLNGGTYDRSNEDGVDADNAGTNTYYTILNHGKMTVDSSVTVRNKGHHSSLFENGYYSQNSKDGIDNPTLTITSGTYEGGLNTIKNDDDATLTINGGTFTNYTQAAFQNHGTATVTAGSFIANSKYAIDNCGCDATHDPGKLEISGGTFNGTLYIRSAYSNVTISDGYFNGSISKTGGTLTITGGYFTSDPTLYCGTKDGKQLTGIPSNDSTYPFTVGTLTANVDVATADPAVKTPSNIDSMPDAEKAVVNNAVSAAAGTTATGLDAIGGKVATDVTNDEVNNAKTTLGKTEGVTVGDQPVTLYVQPYLDITVTGAEVSNTTAGGSTPTTTSLSLEITPMIKKVASTAENEGAIKTEGEGKNAVQIGEAQKVLNVNTPVTIKLALPTGFAQAGEKLSIKHTKENGSIEYYTGIVSTEGTAPDTKTYVTFTTNGFSPFVIYAASANVASIGNNVYPSFQAAVDAAQNNDEITLLKGDAVSATMTGSSKTIKVKASSGVTTPINVTVNGESKTLDNGTAEVTFTYTRPSSSAPTTYAVNVNAATNGAVAADKKTASKGTMVTVTASPSKGYVVDAVKVVDKDGKDVAVTGKDGKYVFTMPGSAVTVTGTFKAETPAPVALPFTDVKSGNWFYDAVKYAYEQGLMTGTSATTFAPNGTMNRAMIVTVLYRLEKSPAVTGASKFTDVPAGQWYSDAVAWAAANKIVNGYDETTFGPMNAVTREQMAAILFRYEQVKGLENVTLEENLNRFPDQNKISAYAIPALQWAVGQKIINGNADGTLDPTGTATRAQVAQIFTNLLNK